jgi:hypothetical protein
MTCLCPHNLFLTPRLLGSRGIEREVNMERVGRVRRVSEFSDLMKNSS